MKIVAKTTKGQEFMFSIRSAHKVNSKKAEKIVEMLNGCRWMLKDGEIWHIYDIDEYDAGAYAWAETQSFFISQYGFLKRRAYD